MKKKAVVVLGNGFDLALGYPTSYSDFYNKSVELRKYAKGGNKLCQHILDNVKSDLWSDLESGLYQYSLYLTAFGSNDECTKQFKKDYEELRSSLYLYLRSISENSIDVEKYATPLGLVVEWNKIEPKYLTFNYSTMTFSYLFGNNRNGLNADDSINEDVFIYQHGSVYNMQNANYNNPEALVLGIDENEQKVDSAHSFLYKSCQNIHNLHSTMNDLTNSDVYILFGCSFGKSDASYFRRIFNNKKDQTFIIYGYGSVGVETAKRNMSALGINLLELQSSNNVYFINSIPSPDNNPRKLTTDLLEGLLL